MKLVKVKGIVVKEVAYGDNDKIITLLTDKFGLISCIAKGAKRTKSALLASSQYLVYSEFVLFKGTSFYHVNSAEVINTFYNLKLDLDKLDFAYSMTKIITFLLNEDIDTEEILKVFLNSLFLIEKNKKSNIEVMNIFRIKTVALLGFSPNIYECNICRKSLQDKKDKCFYDYISNIFLCSCCNPKKSNRQIEIDYPCFMYIRYIVMLDINRIFSISLDEKYLGQLDRFGEALIDCVKNIT